MGTLSTPPCATHIIRHPLQTPSVAQMLAWAGGQIQVVLGTGVTVVVGAVVWIAVMVGAEARAGAGVGVGAVGTRDRFHWLLFPHPQTVFMGTPSTPPCASRITHPPLASPSTTTAAALVQIRVWAAVKEVAALQMEVVPLTPTPTLSLALMLGLMVALELALAPGPTSQGIVTVLALGQGSEAAEM